MDVENTLVRRNVRFVLLNKSNEILLMHVMLPDRTFWCTPGGGVEEGETLEQAARRELFEETGLGEDDVVKGPQIWEGEHLLPRHGVPMLHQEFFFLYRTSSTQIIMDHMTDEEKAVVKSLRWWSVEEMRNTQAFIVPPVLPDLLAQLIEHGAPKASLRVPLGDRT